MTGLLSIKMILHVHEDLLCLKHVLLTDSEIYWPDS